MGVMTEAHVREAVGATDRALRQFRVPAGTIVTPAAKAWLVDQRIDLIIGDERRSHLPAPGPTPRPSAPVSALPAFSKPDHYDLPDGSRVADKPEHMTALSGNMLVEKDHPVIRLRGQLDALEAQIIAAQTTLRRSGHELVVADLAEVLEQVKQIMRAEVVGVRLEERPMLGRTMDQIRHDSHYPQEVFSIPHFFTSVDDGEVVATCNVLRTQVREVELAAYDAFKIPGGEPRRQDILTALNRMSSVFYLMMFKAKTGGYR